MILKIGKLYKVINDDNCLFWFDNGNCVYLEKETIILLVKNEGITTRFLFDAKLMQPCSGVDSSMELYLEEMPC